MEPWCHVNRLKTPASNTWPPTKRDTPLILPASMPEAFFRRFSSWRSCREENRERALGWSSGKPGVQVNPTPKNRCSFGKYILHYLASRLLSDSVFLLLAFLRLPSSRSLHEFGSLQKGPRKRAHLQHKPRSAGGGGSKSGSPGNADTGCSSGIRG